jgi:hypothetical protein
MDEFLYILVGLLTAYAVGTVIACSRAWRTGQDPTRKGLEHDA